MHFLFVPLYPFEQVKESTCRAEMQRSVLSYTYIYMYLSIYIYIYTVFMLRKVYVDRSAQQNVARRTYMLFPSVGLRTRVAGIVSKELRASKSR